MTTTNTTSTSSVSSTTTPVVSSTPEPTAVVIPKVTAPVVPVVDTAALEAEKLQKEKEAAEAAFREHQRRRHLGLC